MSSRDGVLQLLSEYRREAGASTDHQLDTVLTRSAVPQQPLRERGRGREREGNGRTHTEMKESGLAFLGYEMRMET